MYEVFEENEDVRIKRNILILAQSCGFVFKSIASKFIQHSLDSVLK